MLSLPDNRDYTLKGLSLINREKVDAIREAIRELEILEETGFSNKTQLAIAVTGKRLIIPKLLDNTDDEDDLPIA